MKSLAPEIAIDVSSSQPSRYLLMFHLPSKLGGRSCLLLIALHTVCIHPALSPLTVINVSQVSRGWVENRAPVSVKPLVYLDEDTVISDCHFINFAHLWGMVIQCIHSVFL